MKLKLFNKIKKKESISNPVFDKQKIITEILEGRLENCPGWNFFIISSNDISWTKRFDTTYCDFIAIYTEVINKEIRLKSNPFSEYKSTVESAYQIVREIFIEEDIYFEINELSNHFFKRIVASSSKELFRKLKNEV